MTKAKKITLYFNQRNKLSLKHKKYLGQVQWVVKNFLQEDLDTVGDKTTDAVIHKNKRVKAALTAKKSGIIAGIEEVAWICKAYGISTKKYIADGQAATKGDTILTLRGPIKELLIIERTILNVMQRMSGIATQTHRIVKKCGDTVLVCPTRKTHWGLVDKKAVTLGGGGTHRLGLYDFILIKDNHIAAAGKELPKRIAEIQQTKEFWEIEAKTEAQVFAFLAYHPDVIMLDNFTPTHIKHMIKKIRATHKTRLPLFEASGGITEKNAAVYATSGVDIISLGALTHSVTALDISLNITT
ncbi:MAG: nicotinate-nucleotide diphosphorylase (carboxylating) [Candidatus Magasanikbacteria bacterium CG10_big_fil_rev_8_21_14_0_10_43_6]|uniref:Probable nicotinate-nucleotide pyrophosphorylase [carboxylating] n=1 Tax=Candidatus Magasanikbacteria bacterium CG10_big_fil_rev_8_21_14_0_10_43_6 TaxID=1974650 RepID=A0A2M6W2I2_9BACT|nr:MAG: nicotinate-nucleotide diphosphorylase (carboxylating) [Candidatus Magasanikbacteria bacterium CG10_big_fil_rev_8_21_14_0_10_43_6]